MLSLFKPYLVNNKYSDLLHDGSYVNIYSLTVLNLMHASFREQSARNMRHTLAAVILRLLGTRVVQEDADACHLITHKTPRREEEYLVNAPITASLDRSGDSLFDRFLCVLHCLLGNFKPSWLKAKPISKSTLKSRDFSAVDREVSEKLQVYPLYYSCN